MTDEGLSFGTWLHRERLRLDLTRQALADRAGCAEVTLRRIEAGTLKPSRELAHILLVQLGVPAAELERWIAFARGNSALAPMIAVGDAPWRNPPMVPHAQVPRPRTSFVGREKEIQEATRYLEDHRLVTLTGPGGVGKTRLAIEVSTKLERIFRDGIAWIELAGLKDATLIPQAVADALGLREISGQVLKYILLNYLEERQMLLVLDNCEHLVEGCAQVTDMLLNACPGIRILATSRETLGVTGEVVLPVPILSLPQAGDMSPADLLIKYDGIRLFVERASVADPNFKLTKENAVLVAQICQRLDGMPLAIELAAARTAMMSVAEIGRHLDDRFGLLTAGIRTALPRHQTLRAAIDWSYELLSAPERTLFMRLSVFAGGFTLNAAETVASGGEIPKPYVVELLGNLINKSLVMVEPHNESTSSDTRYGMFQTLQEYACAKLQESGKSDILSTRHRRYFITLAELAEPELKGPRQLEWLDRLELEHENFREALRGAREAGDTDACLRLVGELYWFWFRRSHLEEGRVWLEQALSNAGTLSPSPELAKGFYAAAYLSRAQGDFVGAQSLIERSMALWQNLGPSGQSGYFLAQALFGDFLRDGGDPGRARTLLEECVAFFRDKQENWNQALSLMNLGMAVRDLDDCARARSIIEESVELRRACGDIWSIAESLHALALVAYRQGDYEAAYSTMDDILHIRLQLRDRQKIAYSLHNLGVFALAQGDLERAKQFFGQDLSLFHEVGDRSGIALCLQYQGLLAHLKGDDALAQSLLEDGLQLASETGPHWVISNYLLWLAELASVRGQHVQATRLCSAARAQLKAVSSFSDAFELTYFKRINATAVASLGNEVFAREQAIGEGWTREQAIIHALKQS